MLHSRVQCAAPSTARALLWALALGCGPAAAPVDAGSDALLLPDAETPDAPIADAGPVTVEIFADVGATSEGIGLGHDAAGASFLYVGTGDGRIVRVTPAGVVSDFAAIHSPVGLTVRSDGRLLVCASQPAAMGGASGIFGVTVDGVVSLLVASGPGGTPFTLTNFVAEAPDGSFVFSDSGADHLFRADADGGNVSLVTDAITFPNGLAFAADGRTLYVASWDTTTLFALSFDPDTGIYGAPVATLTDVQHVDGVVATSTGSVVLVTTSSGVLHADPRMPTAPQALLAPSARLALPANGVFGDAAFGAHELFVSALGRRSISVVHTDLMGVP